MPSFDVEFEVFCEVCGNGLCNNTTTGKTPGRGQPYIHVDPCPDCMAELQGQIQDLKQDMAELENENANLRQEVENLELESGTKCVVMGMVR